MNIINVLSIIANYVYYTNAQKKIDGGSWSNVIQFTLSPTTGAVLPDGNLLLVSADKPGGYRDDAKGTSYIVVKVNDNNDGISILTKNNPSHFNFGQLFCTGTANLPNGNIFMNGGTGKTDVIEFDWKKKVFSVGPRMRLSRGYNSDVVTTDNKVFTIGGSWPNPEWMPPVNGELYDGKQWELANINGKFIAGTLVNNKDTPSPDPRGGQHESDFHPWLVSYKDNKGNNMIAHLGPVQEMHAFNMNKSGNVINLGFRGNDKYAMWGNIAQYEPGKVLKFGGNSRDLAVEDPYSIQTSILMDITALPNGGKIQVTNLKNMTYPRTFSNSVILPGGKILIIGGQTQAKSFTDSYSVLIPELYNPITNTFKTLAPLQIPRNYHSIALLLPSGKVMSAGGNLCFVDSCDTVHYDGQVYTPDYLQNGLASLRPVITNIDNNGKAYKLTDNIKVTTTSCGNKCTYELIRVSSTTHTVNNDQLRVPLVITNINKNTASVNIKNTQYPFIISGYYMLFAINSAGTPSIAKIIQVTRN